MATFRDTDGNKTWTEGSKVYIEYPQPPRAGGDRRRLVASINFEKRLMNKEVFAKNAMHSQKCLTAISRILLIYRRLSEAEPNLGYNMIFLTVRIPNLEPIRGFVHPFVLLHNPIIHHSRQGHDTQNKIFETDLCPTWDEASRRAHALKERLEREKAQEQENNAGNQPETAQKGLFNGESQG